MPAPEIPFRFTEEPDLLAPDTARYRSRVGRNGAVGDAALCRAAAVKITNDSNNNKKENRSSFSVSSPVVVDTMSRRCAWPIKGSAGGKKTYGIVRNERDGETKVRSNKSQLQQTYYSSVQFFFRKSYVEKCRQKDNRW